MKTGSKLSSIVLYCCIWVLDFAVTSMTDLPTVEINAPETVQIREKFIANISCSFSSSSLLYSLLWNITRLNVNDYDSVRDCDTKMNTPELNAVIGGYMINSLQCLGLLWHRFEKCGVYVLNVELYNTTSITGTVLPHPIFNTSHEFRVLGISEKVDGAFVPIAALVVAVIAISSIFLSYYWHVQHRLGIESANFDFRYVATTAVFHYPNFPPFSPQESIRVTFERQRNNASEALSRFVSAVGESVKRNLGRNRRDVDQHEMVRYRSLANENSLLINSHEPSIEIRLCQSQESERAQSGRYSSLMNSTDSLMDVNLNQSQQLERAEGGRYSSLMNSVESNEELANRSNNASSSSLLINA